MNSIVPVDLRLSEHGRGVVDAPKCGLEVVLGGLEVRMSPRGHPHTQTYKHDANVTLCRISSARGRRDQEHPDVARNHFF